MRVIVEFCLVVLVADFLAGFVHWAQDAYGRKDLPVLGPWIIQPNILHHLKPRSFAKKNWLQSSWDLSGLMLLVILAAWWTGHLTWHVWLLAVLGANSNEIHKWSHRTRKENGKLITTLQRLKIVQTPNHHARHHTDPKDSRYCTITNFLNPLLDGLRFWEGLEWVLLRVFGLRRRVDESVRKPKASSVLVGC